MSPQMQTLIVEGKKTLDEIRQQEKLGIIPKRDQEKKDTKEDILRRYH
jgi:hypothetical protein